MKTDIKQNILLIDDDETGCRFLKAELEEISYKVDIAFRGEEGLKLIKLIKYNLVILNLVMPGMHGLEVLGLIKEYDSSLPVVIFTGVTDPKIVTKCFENGAAAFVNKPYDIYKLLKTVKIFIRKM